MPKSREILPIAFHPLTPLWLPQFQESLGSTTPHKGIFVSECRDERIDSAYISKFTQSLHHITQYAGITFTPECINQGLSHAGVTLFGQGHSDCTARATPFAFFQGFDEGFDCT
jgi:hypothetical protein